jgi:glycosyltransferase involved in cell wall biosynthesis
VNDGSTDESVSVAARFGVRILEQSNRGVAEARNAGLAAAVGNDFVVFLDADDELMHDAVGRGVDELTADPAASAVVGRCEPMDTAGRPLPVLHEEIDTAHLYEEWLSRNFVWTPGAAMFRRNALEAIGGFPTGEFGPASDYSVYLTLARTGGVRLSTRPMVWYRQHETSMSRNPVLMLRATLAVLHRELLAAPAATRHRIRSGRKTWREWYGEQIVHRVRTDWHARRRGADQLRAVVTLLRHCPRVVLRHGWRKARLTAATLWRGTRATVGPRRFRAEPRGGAVNAE